jgi:predicted nucleotidyltransferase component of viral defense system
MGFPTLLDDEAPIISTYPKETVLSEKVHAMIDLDLTNSRLKDYYDVYMILTELAENLDKEVVKKAIEETFKHRGLTLPKNPVKVWTEYFYEDDSKKKQWAGFIRKNKLPSSLTLEIVCKTIAAYFSSVFKAN